jgi:nucleotide-binding universal stress UspA family protein
VPVHATVEAGFLAIWPERTSWKEQAMAGITVGFDGSHGAQLALEWAMREAVARHVPLTVLAVHPVARSGWTGNPIILPVDQQAVAEARRVAEDAIAKATAEVGDFGAAVVRVRAVSGFPGAELINASEQADLVVVGSRGTSMMKRLLLGSVSSEVTHHAHCPVVLVPDGLSARRHTLVAPRGRERACA